jgi:CheY-like chemotaxis protein
MRSNGTTILHVEDDPNDVLLIERALRKAGVTAQVQVVSDGEQAVNYLAAQSNYAERERFPVPVLVLLDLKLPRRSGLEVLEWIRTNPGLKRLPVVMLTSSKQPIDINRAYDLGVNAYLAKPVSFDMLVETLKTLDAFWLRANERPAITRAAAQQ